MYVFGYGSLMWKVDFPYEQRFTGYIKGYQRRFYQHSTDHRGTPDNPGRVVTLVPGNVDSKVYGIAYKIRQSDIENVVKHLDYREKGGYERKSVLFYPIDKEDEPFEMIIYVASHDNPNYAGPADIKSIANQVVNCTGPSGPNVDYVCNLAETMRNYFPKVDDEHLFSLENTVLTLLKQKDCQEDPQQTQIINTKKLFDFLT